MQGTDHKSMLMSHLTGFSKKRVAYDVILKGKVQIAEDTMAFHFEKPKEFHFKAGQHVRVTLIDPPETDSRGIRRFFSLANSPGEKDLILAMRMGPSAFKRVLEKMPVGGQVRIEMLVDSPHESFTLHDDTSKPAIFLIGGIGIVPAFSIIKDWAERKLSHQVVLFYSNRRPEDAPYLNELQQLAKQNPAFKLVATMTAMERSSEPWSGETGYINPAMLRKYLSNHKSPVYYIAGLPEMVDAMRKTLSDIGIKPGGIHAEEFSGFKMSLADDDAYVCPVHPQVIAAKPDHCPKCGQALVRKATSGKGFEKSHLLLSLIVLGIIGFLILHASTVGSLHAGVLSLESPISYLIIVAAIIFIGLKIRFLWHMTHSKGKSILEMHGLGRRDK